MDDFTHPVAPLRPKVLTPLRAELEAQGRTQKWLVRELRAAGVRIEASQVSDYCGGKHLPQPSTRQAIAKALGRRETQLWPGVQRSAA
jgi:transcriptional regulator with XRE-family HTH domain